MDEQTEKDVEVVIAAAEKIAGACENCVCKQALHPDSANETLES